MNKNAREYLDDILNTPEVEHLEDIYEDMMENNDFSHIGEIFDDLFEEIGKKRSPVLETVAEQKKEFEEMRDKIFNLQTSIEDKKILATVLWDGLMVEKIKNYATVLGNPFLADEIHNEYLQLINGEEEEDI